MPQRTALALAAATRPAATEHPLPVPRRDPTGNTAVARADRASRDVWLRPATAQQLRERLTAAIRTEDGRGVRILAGLLARGSA